jgi:hypothetical protein
MKNLIAFAAASLLSATTHAATLDFTSSSTISGLNKVSPTEFTGTIGTVNFTISSAPVALNSGTAYDGDSNGCAPSAPGLACDIDGLGIGGSELGDAETLTLSFDRKVHVSALYFLDLYLNQNKGTERASISFDGASPVFADGEEEKGAPNAYLTGGFKALELKDIVAQEIVFTAPFAPEFLDDATNDYALAAIDVTAVPVPAAAFLFAPALVGFMGLRRKAAKKA